MRRAPLLPGLVFLIIVTQLPFVATLVISFTALERACRRQNKGFAGIDNYRKVFTDPDLRSSVLFTIVLTVTVVLVSLVLGHAASRCCSTGSFFGRGIVRTLMITPFLVVPVAAALLFKHGIYNPELRPAQRHVDRDLEHLRRHRAATGLADRASRRSWSRPQLIWQWTPFMMLILLAGLQSRDKEVVEAAHVDGATPWQVFRYITFPHMRQYLELGALLGSIYIVQNFDTRLHDHVRRSGHGEPAVHDLPDVLQRARLRPGLCARCRGCRGRVIDHRDVRAARRCRRCSRKR